MGMKIKSHHTDTQSRWILCPQLFTLLEQSWGQTHSSSLVTLMVVKSVTQSAPPLRGVGTASGPSYPEMDSIMSLSFSLYGRNPNQCWKEQSPAYLEEVLAFQDRLLECDLCED